MFKLCILKVHRTQYTVFAAYYSVEWFYLKFNKQNTYNVNTVHYHKYLKFLFLATYSSVLSCHICIIHNENEKNKIKIQYNYTEVRYSLALYNI